MQASTVNPAKDPGRFEAMVSAVRAKNNCVPRRHGLSLLRCLEVANRLSPNLHGEDRIRDSACRAPDWPWQDLKGAEVLQLLWTRLAEAASVTA